MHGLQKVLHLGLHRRLAKNLVQVSSLARCTAADECAVQSAHVSHTLATASIRCLLFHLCLLLTFQACGAVLMVSGDACSCRVAEKVCSCTV